MRGVTFRLRQDGDEVWVERMPQAGPDSPNRPARRRLVLSTGSHASQVYWMQSGKGRAVDLLPFLYRIHEQCWVPLEASFVFPPGPAADVETGAWNRVCSQCHATAPQPRPRAQGHMDTHVAELGISCEACHGPGEVHVRRNTSPLARYRNWTDGRPDRSIVQPLDLSPRLASHICAQCHSSSELPGEAAEAAWLEHGHAYLPGEDFEATRRFRDSGDDQFWSDGMARVSGAEYNGMAASPCVQQASASEALSCLSCHVMHAPRSDPRPRQVWAADQLKLGMEGNRACTQCHTALADESSLVVHTRHRPTSSGSNCYNCHMPHTAWGQMKAIRSHAVSSPSVAAELDTGRPNACNLCHLDKTLAWTAAQLHEGWGTPPPELNRDQQTVAAAVLTALRGDAGQRALMAWHFGWPFAQETSGADWIAPVLARLLSDPYPVVRFRAHQSLQTLPGIEPVPYDFLAPSAQRTAAVQAVLSHWANRGSPPRQRAAGLFDQNGALHEALLDRLWSQRNDRPLFLKE